VKGRVWISPLSDRYFLQHFKLDTVLQREIELTNDWFHIGQLIRRKLTDDAYINIYARRNEFIGQIL
jgi:hypothetical protein